MATMTRIKQFAAASTAVNLGIKSTLLEMLNEDPALIYATGRFPENQSSLLHLAAKARQPGIVKLLLSKGAEPLYQNVKDIIPLSYAIEYGCKKSFDLLLQVSLPRINDFVCAESTTPNKKTRALWHAVSGSQIHMIKTLVENGADPFLSAYEGGPSIFDLTMAHPDLPRAHALNEAISIQNSRSLQDATPVIDRASPRRSL